MSYEEKRTWVYLVSSAVAYGAYLAIISARAAHSPVAQVPYVTVLLVRGDGIFRRGTAVNLHRRRRG